MEDENSATALGVGLLFIVGTVPVFYQTLGTGAVLGVIAYMTIAFIFGFNYGKQR